MLRAVKLVKNDKRSARSVAKDFSIPYRTLQRYCNKATANDLTESTVQPSFPVGYIRNKQVFSDEQEISLEIYLKKASVLLSSSFIFPRVHFKDHFLQCAPSGSSGGSNPSGWMNEDNFIAYVKHFIQNVKCSKDAPALLLLDNHDSHLSIEALDLLKDNGVTVLSFPPHCSHKLQPLDRSVYGPFKKYVNTACDNWMTTNPGKTMTIYESPGVVKTALTLAATPSNIIAGFQRTGVYPFNDNIFPESEFLASYCTYRPLSTDEAESSHEVQCFHEDLAAAGPSGIQQDPIPTPPPMSIVTPPPPTPEEVRPFQKAPPRERVKTNRKRSSAILTDTPVKKSLEDREKAKCLPQTRKVLLKSKGGNPPIQKKNKSKILESSDSDEEDTFCLMCMEPYSNSKPGEPWIQCRSCLMWAHEKCSDGNLLFICENCDSTNDLSE